MVANFTDKEINRLIAIFAKLDVDNNGTPYPLSRLLIHRSEKHILLASQFPRIWKDYRDIFRFFYNHSASHRLVLVVCHFLSFSLAFQSILPGHSCVHNSKIDSVLVQGRYPRRRSTTLLPSSTILF